MTADEHSITTANSASRPRLSDIVLRPWTLNDLQRSRRTSPNIYFGLRFHVAITTRELWYTLHHLTRFCRRNGQQVGVLIDHDPVAARLVAALDPKPLAAEVRR